MNATGLVLRALLVAVALLAVTTPTALACR